MSVIVIKWRMIGTFGLYDHYALLLSKTSVKDFPELKSSQTKDEDFVYISVYEADKGKRFTSQLLSQDKNSGRPVHCWVLPTSEDGNETGLSETAMAIFWENIYKLKKESHEKTEAKMQDKKEDEGTLAQGKQKAIVNLSTQFKQFDHRKLNCFDFVGNVLEKGGATAFVERKPKEGFSEYYLQNLVEAIQKEFARQQKQMILKPVEIIENTNVQGESAEARAYQRSFFRI